MNHTLQLTEQQTKLLDFVKMQHESQTRKYSLTPYWTHLISVAQIVSEFEKNDCAFEIAICHDLLEDTPCTESQLYEKLIHLEYGPDRAVHIVAKIKGWQMFLLKKATRT